MRAFLSHSSKDKQIVDEVAELIGGANVELDSETFEHGLPNVQIIQAALRRASLFVLFLSKNALASNVVRFEALMARELISQGIIDRFLVICLDEESFTEADSQWKTFNFVRKILGKQSIARTIQNALILANSKQSSASFPFVGRAAELHAAKEKLIDPMVKSVQALFVSGSTGIGRRTFAKRLFEDVYPQTSRVLPEIHVEQFDGNDEIFRKILGVVSPIASLSAYRTRIAAFAIDSAEGKSYQIARLIESLVDARETLIIHDHGGLLDDSGAMREPFRNLLSKVKTYPHVPIVFVAGRMMPQSKRTGMDGVLFSPLSALAREEVKQLAALLLKREGLSYSFEELEQIVDLCDGHPFNVIFAVGLAKQYTLQIFLADPKDLIHFKRNRASEFVQKLAFSEDEIKLLGAFRDFNALDFETLSIVFDKNSQAVARALTRLIDLHIIEAQSVIYTVSPPLRVAIERDSRFSLSPVLHKRMLEAVGSAFNTSSSNESTSLSLVNSAILAQLQSTGAVSELFGAFLLPSHYVWLARRRYDEREFEDCIRLASSALASKTQLSEAGLVEACRLQCLAAARLGNERKFSEGIDILKAGASNKWARSNLNFLLGFNARLKGYLPEAEDYFQKSYGDSPGNFSAVRELASIHLVRGDIDAAERFAREAFQSAQDNPYVLDILLSILLKKQGSNRALTSEISTLFEKLKNVGEEQGHSFYTTRRAEFEWKFGSVNEACKLIDSAVAKTPHIFNVRALRAEIYLDSGNKTIAWDEIKKLRDSVYRNQGNDRRSNLRQLLQLEASYYLANGNFNEAKEIYQTKDVFSRAETAQLVKSVETEQAFRSK